MAAAAVNPRLLASAAMLTTATAAEFTATDRFENANPEELRYS